MISIIVPVYNAENFLHYCIDSIIAQTYKDYELILVDDGSTDGSGKICDKYAEQYERVTTVHLNNGGVSRARNKGIELSKGEFICFVDSDDYIEKDYLKAMLMMKEEYPEYDNHWCGMCTVDGYEGGKVLQNAVYSDEVLFSSSSTEEIMTLHDKWLDAGPVCKLYEKSIINNNRIRFLEDLSLGEDLVFNYNYLNCTNGKIIIANRCLYNYVQINNSSLTKVFHEDLFSKYQKINSILYTYMTKWNCDSFQFTKFYTSCFFIYEFVLRNTYKANYNQIKKFNYNRMVMKSKEFKTSLQNSDCYINPLYRFGYKHALSVFVRVLDLITIIKK